MVQLLTSCRAWSQPHHTHGCSVGAQTMAKENCTQCKCRGYYHWIWNQCKCLFPKLQMPNDTVAVCTDQRRYFKHKSKVHPATLKLDARFFFFSSFSCVKCSMNRNKTKNNADIFLSDLEQILRKPREENEDDFFCWPNFLNVLLYVYDLKTGDNAILFSFFSETGWKKTYRRKHLFVFLFPKKIHFTRMLLPSGFILQFCFLSVEKKKKF